MPFPPDSARSVEPQLAERTPRKLSVAGIPAVAYPLDSPDDTDWTHSATVGYPVLAAAEPREGRERAGRRLPAAPDTPKDPASLLVILWSDEGTKGATWKLLGLELPLVR